MSVHEVLEEKEREFSNGDEEEEGENFAGEFGEGGIVGDVDVVVEEFEEEQKKDWLDAGEYGEGAPYYIYKPAAEGSLWEEKEGSITSATSAAESEIEETEEEKELKREKGLLIEELKQKIFDRMLLKTRNSFLQKKLAQHFKKRRMENVFKEEPKGLDLEKKYLRRLFAFQEFKQAQEDEIHELTENLEKFKCDTEQLEEELREKLNNFTNRAKEVSLNLILSKTGKKLSEKVVDRFLKRYLKKNEEKGKRKLKNIKIKNLIEEKETQLKAMEYIGEGLYTGDYEQMKIDNQNLWDKIEEKEDELTKMRLKTQTIMQYLSQIKETSHCIESDIELMSEKVYDVEKRFSELRKRLTETRKKRDLLREDLCRLKSTSGLLTKNDLLKDFEASIYEAKTLAKNLEILKKQMQEKKKEEFLLTRAVLSNIKIPSQKADSPSLPAVQIPKSKKAVEIPEYE